MLQRWLARVRELFENGDKTMYIRNGGQFSEYHRGKYRTPSILDDESVHEKTVRYMRDNACKKGQLNLTAYMFYKWVNFELLPTITFYPSLPHTISIETACVWLYQLDFQPIQILTGLYIEDHECPDIVKHHKGFLTRVRELANDAQVKMWGEPDTHMIRPKSSGAGLMVSGFIDDFCGFLRLSDEEFQSIPEGVEKPETKEAR